MFIVFYPCLVTIYPLPPQIPCLPGIACSPLGLAQEAFLIGKPSEVPIFKARNSLFCITLVFQAQECTFRSLTAWI